MNSAKRHGTFSYATCCRVGFCEVIGMSEEKHWGQQLLKLLDSLDMNSWDALILQW
jgi:hypothetical protein